MRLSMALLMLFLVTAGLGSGGFYYNIQEPLPPPATNISLAVLAPVSHARLVVVSNNTLAVQAAPHSPLAIFVAANLTLTVALNGEVQELNGTGERVVLVEDLGSGRYWSVRISSRNATISIYALSSAEEAALASSMKPPSVDPSWVKRVRAVTAALVAVLAGVPLGYRIKRKVVERKAKKIPREEL